MLTAIPTTIVIPVFDAAMNIEALLDPYLATPMDINMFSSRHGVGFPHIGMNIVTDFVETFLNSRLEWSKGTEPFHAKLKKHLRSDIDIRVVERIPASELKHFCRYPHLVPDQIEVQVNEDVSVWCEEVVRSHMLTVINDLMEFIGNDTWNIYTTRRIGLDLAICKGADYRIEDWTRLKRLGKI